MLQEAARTFRTLEDPCGDRRVTGERHLGLYEYEERLLNLD